MAWDDLKMGLRSQFLPGNSYASMDAFLRLRYTRSIREYVKAHAALMLEIEDISNHDMLYHFLASLQPWA